MKGQGWYVCPRNLFIPLKQGFEPLFQNPVSDACARTSGVKICFAIDKEIEQQQVACQALGIMV